MRFHITRHAVLPAPSNSAADPEFKVCQSQRLAGFLNDAEILNLNTYDFMAYIGKSVINPGGRRGQEQIFALSKLPPNARVLEIGCGTGHAACAMARRYRCRVTAVDISPAMVEGARRTVRSQGLQEQVVCQVGDIVNLPFAAGTFDYVIVQAVLMFVEKQRALAEIQRVLRAGGMFAGLEFSWRRKPTDVVRDTTYRICGCRTLEFYDADQWQARLQRAGLERIYVNEQRFAMLSMGGFIYDEGLGNTLRILLRVLRRQAVLRRMHQIWQHFSRNIDDFSYVVLSGQKPRLQG